MDELAEGPTSFVARLSLISALSGSEYDTSDPLLKKVATAAAIDPVMTSLREIIQKGFLNEKCNLPLPLRPFWCVRSHLSIDSDDDLIVLGARVVVLESIRREVLQNLLMMYQGATKLRQWSRQTMY